VQKGIRAPDAAEHLAPQPDAEAVDRTCRIPLEYVDAPAGPGQFQQPACEQATRAAADHGHPHAIGHYRS
jgi:hypothetical protein